MYIMNARGQFDSDQFTATDFSIKPFGNGTNEHYICVRHQHTTPYLHKNGEVHDTCGVANICNSIEEAQAVIDMFYNTNEPPSEDYRLPEDLFKLEI